MALVLPGRFWRPHAAPWDTAWPVLGREDRMPVAKCTRPMQSGLHQHSYSVIRRQQNQGSQRQGKRSTFLRNIRPPQRLVCINTSLHTQRRTYAQLAPQGTKLSASVGRRGLAPSLSVSRPPTRNTRTTREAGSLCAGTRQLTRTPAAGRQRQPVAQASASHLNT